MAHTSTPAPHRSNVAVVADVKRDGGQVRYNGDGDQLVTFPDDLARRRMLAMLAERVAA